MKIKNQTAFKSLKVKKCITIHNFNNFKKKSLDLQA